MSTEPDLAYLLRSIHEMTPPQRALLRRLLELGPPGSPDVLGPSVLTEEPGDAPGCRAYRPGYVSEERAAAGEVWRVLARRVGQ